MDDEITRKLFIDEIFLYGAETDVSPQTMIIAVVIGDLYQEINKGPPYSQFYAYACLILASKMFEEVRLLPPPMEEDFRKRLRRLELDMIIKFDFSLYGGAFAGPRLLVDAWDLKPDLVRAICQLERVSSPSLGCRDRYYIHGDIRVIVLTLILLHRHKHNILVRRVREQSAIRKKKTTAPNRRIPLMEDI